MTPETLYREIYRIRAVEEACCRVYASDKIQSPFHSSIGQELASVAVCGALKPGDTVFGSYRSHAAYLAAGGDLKAFIAELYGKKTGCCGGKGGSMHLAHLGPTSSGLHFLGTSAIVASLIPVAVGYAFAQKLRNTGLVTVVFFGDGATEEGCFFESLNFAALHKLPILFVCENNGLAICSPLRARQSSPITDRAQAIGISSWLAIKHENVLTMARELTEIIRAEHRPMFYEVRSQRLKEHVGPNEDWAQGFRVPDLDWKDPVEEAASRLTPAACAQIELDVSDEIAAAFAFAEASAAPGPEDLMTDLYG